MHRPLRLACLLAALLGALLLAGCDTSFEPFARQGAYSIYGYLSVTSERQFIRVKPLNRPLGSDSTQPLDATVTLENLATGETITLTDSIVTFTDQGTRVVTHNYWTDAPIQPSTRYRLTVDGPAGTTRATTTTPTGTDAVIRPDSTNCIEPFTLIFRDTDRLPLFADIRFAHDGENPAVRVLEENPPPRMNEPTYRFLPSRILAERIPLPPQPGPTIQCAPRCSALDDPEIAVEYVYVSPNWVGGLPADPMDFNPRIDQENLDNGAGFFGALRRDTITAVVDTSSVLIAPNPPPGTCGVGE
jgi:hypothetical protein